MSNYAGGQNVANAPRGLNDANAPGVARPATHQEMIHHALARMFATVDRLENMNNTSYPTVGDGSKDQLPALAEFLNEVPEAIDRLNARLVVVCDRLRI